MSAFENGAVFFLDALGFKGIWKKHAPDAVLTKLKLLGTVIEGVSAPATYELGGTPSRVDVEPNISVASLSDTVCHPSRKIPPSVVV